MHVTLHSQFAFDWPIKLCEKPERREERAELWLHLANNNFRYGAQSASCLCVLYISSWLVVRKTLPHTFDVGLAAAMADSIWKTFGSASCAVCARLSRAATALNEAEKQCERERTVYVVYGYVYRRNGKSTKQIS